MKVTLKQSAQHPKDIMAGWHEWRVSGECAICGKPFTASLHGTRQHAEAVTVCDECL